MKKDSLDKAIALHEKHLKHGGKASPKSVREEMKLLKQHKREMRGK